MPKPNLVFIMTDQQRFDALGTNGNARIHTPNLDRLSTSGANVQGYYTNSPVCVPSRCTLFTGRYPHSHRIRENHNMLEDGREIHLFRALKQAGYSLGYVGKNHLLEQEEFANFDFVDLQSDFKEEAPQKRLSHLYSARRNELNEAEQPEIWRAGHFHDLPEECTRTHRTAQGALRFLDERPEEVPFCLCVSFSDPHVPHQALRRFESMYPPSELDLYPRRNGELSDRSRRFGVKWRAQKADRADDADMRRYMAIYYAMITYVDEMIGRILTSLREQGLEEDTLVVFTSDHGEFCFEHGMYKKDLVLVESLLHVPLLLSWPGRIQPQKLQGTLVEEVDAMPTILELMGMEAPFGVQGTSFAPCLRGETGEHKSAVFAEVCPPWLYSRFADYESFEAHHGSWAATPMNVPGDFTKAIREKDWRYIWYGTGEEELFDLRQDPHELRNRADDPACASEKARLKLRLLEWLALSEDPLDPLSIRQLQTKYANWQGSFATPGPHAGPGWLDERFTPNPRLP